MVARKILILLVVVFVFYGCNEYGAIYDNKKCKNTEPNISVEEDCLGKNIAILTNSLINLLGKDYVSQMLENNINVNFVFNVDSNGCVLNIVIIRDREDYLSEITKQQIVNYLIKNNVCFDICYTTSPYYDEESKKRVKKSVIEGFKLPVILSVSTPIYLMMHYESENKNKDEHLSKYEYLKLQIEKYLPKN